MKEETRDKLLNKTRTLEAELGEGKIHFKGQSTNLLICSALCLLCTIIRILLDDETL